MSDFVPLLVDLLPLHCELQKEDNPVRKVLDYTLGEYMDQDDDLFDQLFLTSASGGWLDAHGRDYGVSRRLGEDDESYRSRIVFEKLEYLNARNLLDIFGLPLFTHINGYTLGSNQLTSDNPYISSGYMSYADEDLRKILNSKFVIGGGLTWL